MIGIKSPEEIARMRISCRMAAQVRDHVVAQIRPGITTRELDEQATELLRKLGAKSAFLGYHGYPGHICVSVNEEVVHGIPGDRRIRDGDLVSVDVGVEFDGFIGDTAITVLVGKGVPALVRLLETGQRALEAGIAHACAGAHLSDISHAIEETAKRAGYSVVRDFLGHGIGRSMHEDPQIPNYGPPGQGPVLKPGMTLALEPMINMGDWKVEVLQDGWTVVTKDRKPSVHFEHTVVVGVDGAEVLTCADPLK